jgi:hypothetical protein
MKHPNPKSQEGIRYTSDGHISFTHADQPTYSSRPYEDVAYAMRQIVADAAELASIGEVLLAYFNRLYGIEWWSDVHRWYLKSYGVDLGQFYTFHEMIDWILKADWKALHAYRNEDKQDG